MNFQGSFDDIAHGVFDVDAAPVAAGRVLSEEAFNRMISLERKRTERSHKPFLLMLLDVGEEISCGNGESGLAKILSVLSLAARETDALGWYKNGLVVGALFTDIAPADKLHILNTVLTRVSRTLQNTLSLEEFNQLSISFHWFPEEWGNAVPKRPSDPVLYPDLAQSVNGNKLRGKIKRVMDIAGSALALVICSPMLLLISILVKLSSEGPVLFRQKRLGQFGHPFTFLKFRTMHVNSDATIHKEFMKRVIHGKYEGKDGRNGATVYKMTDDPRTTRIGRFLRRTSLDELPQFINVLRGEMSLVGPRPPIAYEFQQYDIWHRRRVLEVKPGITGLWQINGRSRVRFDEMVRLDLRYVRTWSIWLDIQILLQTPKAVLLGNDAF